MGEHSLILKDKTDKTVNNFNTNKVIADITETENNYNIIPGTSQSKDPTVIVETTIPAYCLHNYRR